MPEEHKPSTEQFGAVASRYVQSDVHARGRTLRRIIELLIPQPNQVALDVATGAGHTAIALAPHVSTVYATDITPQMLHEARKLAQERGVKNIKFEIAAAESLPYPDGTFDIATCRVAAHHFIDVKAFVRESLRVLKPGGKLAVVDDTVPEDPEAAAYLNEIEWLRDRSHIRNYKPSEWKGFLEEAGFLVESLEVMTDLEEGMSYLQWMHRANAPEEVVAQVREKLLCAPAAAKGSYGVQEAGDDLRLFLPNVVILGSKPE